MLLPVRWAMVVAVALTAAAEAQVAPVPPQPAGPTPAEIQARNKAEADNDKRLQTAVDQLVAEAQAVNGGSGAGADKAARPVFFRPHATLAGFDADMVGPALKRMASDFTGNEYLDTYVRWHLMWVVEKGDMSRHGPALLEVVRKVPGPISIPPRPTTTYEPMENARAYADLVASLRIVKGYPPFQTVVNPPDSLAELGPDAAVKWKQAQAMRNSFKTIVDNDAVAFNGLVKQMNDVVRQYRGEVIGALVKTGDPENLKRVMAEIDRQANLQSPIALDMLGALYQAAFDGVLSKYPQAALAEASRQLEKTAVAHQEWVTYLGIRRNFRDYAFHMVFMLKDGGGFINASREGAAAAPAPGNGK